MRGKVRVRREGEREKRQEKGERERRRRWRKRNRSRRSFSPVFVWFSPGLVQIKPVFSLDSVNF